MSKKNIYLVNISAIAAFLIIVAVLLFINHVNQKNPTIQSQLKNNSPVSENKKPDSSVQKNVVNPDVKTLSAPVSPLDFAEKNGQVEDCLKSANENYKKTCVILLAQYLQSSSTCHNLKSQDDQLKCADEAIYEKATKNNRISFCLNIKSDELILSCVQRIISNIGAQKGDCDALPDKERKYCLDFLAYSADQTALKSAKSLADCPKISDKFLNSVCSGNFPQISK
jgi:hypothetical protein